MTDPKLEELARELAASTRTHFLSLSGFDHWWYSIDEDIRENIRDALIGINDTFLQRAQRIQPEPSADLEALARRAVHSCTVGYTGISDDMYDEMLPYLQLAEAGGVKKGLKKALGLVYGFDGPYRAIRALIESE